MISATDLIAKFQYAIDNDWGYIWGKAGVKWTQAMQNAATNEMAKKYGSRWIGHMVADCSGLFVWAFKQLGGSIYHGSNTMYKSYCSANGTMSKGKRTDGIEMRPGTAVFVWNDDDKKWSHVGLYIGDGKVIEAASTQKGVIVSDVTNKKWTYWGELKNVEYSGIEPSPAPEKKPTLRKGDAGPYVTLAQTALINRGYDLGKWGADGKFGDATERAVKQFQQDWELSMDGVIGPRTWEMLLSSPVKVTYTVRIPNVSQSEAEALVKQYPGATMQKEGE